MDHYQRLAERQKSEHFQQLRQVQTKLEGDKQQLKHDYDQLIDQIRTEYQQQKNDLRD